MNRIIIILVLMTSSVFSQSTVIGNYEAREHFGYITYATCTISYIDINGHNKQISNPEFSYYIWSPHFEFIEYEFLTVIPYDAIPVTVTYTININTSNGYQINHYYETNLSCQ